jgi:hypothetical protein
MWKNDGIKVKDKKELSPSFLGPQIGYKFLKLKRGFLNKI